MTISLLLLAAHLIGDFLLQDAKTATKKFDDWHVRLGHVVSYSLPFILILGLFDTPLGSVFLVANAAINFVIDSRRWMVGRGGFDGYPMVVDQTLHITTIAVLATLLA